MLDRAFKLVTSDLGIDLGSSWTRILVLGKGVAVREPSVIARHKKSKEIVAVGTEAKKMIGRTPNQLETVCPLIDGVISDFDATVGLLAHYFKALHQGHGLRIRIPRPKVAISIPTGITDVERKAVQDAALTAGAREAFLVESPMAAAIGAGLPIFEPAGALIVDIGGGTTELAVISLGGIVINKSLRLAGSEMDEAIINFIKLKYSVLIGSPTAESLKTEIGSATEIKAGGKSLAERQMIIRGRDLGTGLPRSLRLNGGEVREALSPFVNQIAAATADIIEEIPPELLGDITQKGIYLCGGVSLLPGLGELVEETIKMPCTVLKDPTSVVVWGCGQVLEDESLLKKVRVRGGVK
jgi:rod shape-determining protein MreB